MQQLGAAIIFAALAAEGALFTLADQFIPPLVRIAGRRKPMDPHRDLAITDRWTSHLKLAFALVLAVGAALWVAGAAT
ncbi:MAG: hypothetical protein ACKVVT_03400 [Dehalococcoidia bacterium]